MSNILPSIIEPTWLSEQLNQTELCIIDCRFRLEDTDWGEQEYLTQHIPTAHYLHLDRDLSGHGTAADRGRHPLPCLNDFYRTLQSFGFVYQQTPVVIYDSNRQGISARVWWLLRYLGHDAIAFLNGGWQGWHQLNLPTEKKRRNLPLSPPNSPLPTPDSNAVISQKELRSQLQKPDLITLIDARAPERYRGEQEPIDPVAGRIPGSVNAFWQDLISEDHRWRSTEWQRHYWSQRIPNLTDHVVVYCGSGVTACVLFFSLKTLGYQNIQLYVGGWSEWCTNSEFSE